MMLETSPHHRLQWSINTAYYTSRHIALSMATHEIRPHADTHCWNKTCMNQKHAELFFNKISPCAKHLPFQLFSHVKCRPWPLTVPLFRVATAAALQFISGKKCVWIATLAHEDMPMWYLWRIAALQKNPAQHIRAKICRYRWLFRLSCRTIHRPIRVCPRLESHSRYCPAILAIWDMPDFPFKVLQLK